MIAIEVIEGPDRGRRFELPVDEPQLLGRSTEAIPFTDQAMSRRHAELTPGGGRWWLRDLRSTNGTFVNGAPVLDVVELRDGDRIRCGDTLLRITAAEGAARLPTGAAAESVSLEPGADAMRLAAIGETMATLSHSIKNILQGLRGGADAVELALTQGSIERAREGWPILARNLDRVLSLTMNMLAYARERPLDLEPAQPNDVVRDVADLLGAPCRRKRVTLELELDESMPPIPIDASAVHQALVNLAFNAIEAAPDRTGTVTLRTRFGPGTDDPDASACIIEVEDNGPGIPPAQQSRLFEPFATTKGQRGTGLGLAVARKLAERHGGSLVHAPRPSGGTRMILNLPAHRDDDGERTRAPQPFADDDVGIDFEQ